MAVNQGDLKAAPFPERDPAISAEGQGLFRKFEVRRVDGGDAPGGKHEGCRYFVLDLDHDPHAHAAMAAYAAECGATQPLLAEDIRKLGIARAAPGALGWQPMATAPLNGDEVLLIVERRAGMPWCQLVGHYMPGGHCIEDHPPIGRGWYFWNGAMFDLAAKPLFWMPLPERPQVTPQ